MTMTRRVPFGLVLGLVLILATACTTYQYQGGIDSTNSDGREVKALAHWQRTERLLWFDTVSGAVRVQTQCSANTLVFNEGPDGIVLSRTPELEGTTPDCGRVLDAKRIQDLDTGEVRIQVRCVAAVDDFTANPERASFIAARTDPYVFTIERVEGGRAPKVAACSER
jgi:hypothetical protein